MDELVQWLRAQLDEDTARAVAAADELDGPELGAEWQYDGRYVVTVRERTMVAVGSQDFMEPKVGEHIAARDPARVLREIDAKRQILAIHRPYVSEPGQACLGCAGGIEFESCPIVRLLALPYSDRPRYREEWRP